MFAYSVGFILSISIKFFWFGEGMEKKLIIEFLIKHNLEQISLSNQLTLLLLTYFIL